ncbi:MAG: glycosyltransferase family 9 protein [Endomicrobia bacterium]|nr:glycosyltransferase family 9 protein [Endomicrobiia bacterium]MCL2506450.1 glycosyltransferase family 9 protein [Endomicrobiia bacterium]
MKIKNTLTSLRKSLAKFLFDKKQKSNKTFYIKNIKSVLFLRNDNKIGDMVVLTLVFRELKIKYPAIKISVLCCKDNKEIIKNNPNVDEIVETPNICKKNDLAVDFFVFRPRPKHLLMLRRINPAFLIGFNKKDYNIYDLSIDCDINRLHISKRYEILLETLGVKPASLKYDICIDENLEKKAKEFFSANKSNLIINPFAASKHRSFSFDKLQSLINGIKEKFDVNIYAICEKKSAGMLKGLKGAKILETGSILESAAYIKYCDYVLTPDTSIVHIAAAFGKKMIALYLDYSSHGEKINEVWAPGYADAVQISVDTKNGTLENDINNIDNEAIINKFGEII